MGMMDFFRNRHLTPEERAVREARGALDGSHDALQHLERSLCAAGNALRLVFERGGSLDARNNERVHPGVYRIDSYNLDVQQLMSSPSLVEVCFQDAVAQIMESIDHAMTLKLRARVMMETVKNMMFGSFHGYDARYTDYFRSDQGASVLRRAMSGVERAMAVFEGEKKVRGDGVGELETALRSSLGDVAEVYTMLAGFRGQERTMDRELAERRTRLQKAIAPKKGPRR